MLVAHHSMHVPVGSSHACMRACMCAQDVHALMHAQAVRAAMTTRWGCARHLAHRPVRPWLRATCSSLLADAVGPQCVAQLRAASRSPAQCAAQGNLPKLGRAHESVRSPVAHMICSRMTPAPRMCAAPILMCVGMTIRLTSVLPPVLTS